MKPILSPIINRLVDNIPDSVRARIPEGSASRELLGFLSNTLQQKRAITNVAETGFNTGGSSRAFLAARPDVNVVSFDIGKHVLVRRKKAQLDKSYPGRHELVLGDSTETLPAFARTHPDLRFDLVFIDGGHDYEVAMADIVNFRRMAHADTIVIMDDMTPWWEWGEGPTKAWREAVAAGVIVGSQLYKNGQQVTELTGRGLDSIWAVGFYHFEQS
jgi:predicted O-methyltransferase YrrM